MCCQGLWFSTANDITKKQLRLLWYVCVGKTLSSIEKRNLYVGDSPKAIPTQAFKNSEYYLEPF